MHDLEFLIPIVAMLGGFLLVAALRYMRHIERMNMIERGLGTEELAKAERKRDNPFSMAYLLIGAALGLVTAIFTTRILGGWLSEDEGVGLYFAFIGIGAGVGLLMAGNKAKHEG